MPDLSLEEALEITKIHSASGKLQPEQGLMTVHPFRLPTTPFPMPLWLEEDQWRTLEK